MLWYSLLSVALLGLAGAFYLTNPIVGSLPAAPEKPIEVDEKQLWLDVVYLAEACHPRNFYNQPQLNKAADYIGERLGKLGYAVETQHFMAAKVPHRNLIARIGPATDEIIVVGAHYDVCDEQPGADDNASAVAGLLAIAELLKANEAQLTAQIELVAYSLEEPPFFRTKEMGSYVHAESLHKAHKKVKAMVCLEMIGYFSDEPNSQSYPVNALKALYPSTGNFIAVVGKMGEGNLVRHFKRYMKAGANLPVSSINAPQSLRGIDLSDHRNYWHFGYPAVMITDTSFFRNDNYHEETDTPDTLDYVRMAEVVKGVFWGVMNL